MGERRSQIAIALGRIARSEVVNAAQAILQPATWSVSPEERGWVAVGISPNAATPEGWIEQLCRRAKVVARVSWRFYPISQSGIDVFDPSVGEWQVVELIHDGQVEKSNPELHDRYSLPEHFFWEYSHLHPNAATPELDAALMDDAWCLDRARKGAVQDIMAVARWQPGRAVYWLVVAEDGGHDIGSSIQDLHNYTSLHHDDGTQWGWVQLDLVRDYACGTVLQRNLDRASVHLDEYLSTGGGIDEVEALLPELPPDARALVEQRIGPEPFRHVRRRLERLEKLASLHAPTVILRTEIEALQAEVMDLGGKLTDDEA